MHDWVLSFCQRLEKISWLMAIDNSPTMGPGMYIAHYFSIFLLVGTSAIVNLRILVPTGRRQNVTELAEQLFPWTWIAFSIAVVTGLIMFAPDATTFFPRIFFWIKLPVVLLAAVFTLIVQHNVRKWDQSPAIPTQAKLTAFVSLALWIGTILTALEIPQY